MSRQKEKPETRNPRVGRNGMEPPPAHRWKKGQSGNPGGRKRAVLDTEKLAQKHAEEAIQALVEVMNCKKAVAVARVQAAQAILDRGFGKPNQAIKAEHTLTLNEAFEGVLREIHEDRQRKALERARKTINLEAVNVLPAE